MSPILGSSGLGLRGRSSRSSPHEPAESSTSSRRQSHSSSTRKASRTSSYMDDWSDGFTGIVDLDRKMRELAMAEQGLSDPYSNSENDVYEPYSPSASSTPWSDQQKSRRKSSSDARCGSGSQSSLATGRSVPSFSNLHATSSASTAATSRFSQDSRAHSSLLAKRRSSSANTVESFDSAHSPLRLAPLPASPSAFGNYRLTEAPIPARQSGVFSSPSWSSLDEQDPLTPLAAATRQLEPITPGTAAAATWTDPTAPGYFPAGLSMDSKKKARSLRKKATTARAPLPRLVSGEVVSSPAAESDLSVFGASSSKHDPVKAGQRSSPLDMHSDGIDDEHRHQAAFASTSASVSPSSSSSSSNSYALRRSAQSLALSFRFTMLKAKRKVKRTGQGATDLFAQGHGSQRSSIEASLST